MDAVRLSDLITEPVDYLKVDIEGSEFGVLKDLCATGKMALVKYVACELHGVLLCKTRLRNCGRRFRERASASRLETRRCVKICQGHPCPPRSCRHQAPNISSGSMLGVCRDSDRILP